MPTTQPDTQTLPLFSTFDKQKETWHSYIARLEHHFTAYGTQGEVQRKAFLMAQASPAIYQLVTQFHPDEDPEVLTYRQIKISLAEYFDSQIHVAAARHRFFNCRKDPSESYREWITRLQGLSRECKFACTNLDVPKILLFGPSMRHDFGTYTRGRTASRFVKTQRPKLGILPSNY